MPTDPAVLPESARGCRLLSGREARAFLGVSKRKLWEMTLRYKGSDRLPSYKIGGSRKFRLDQLLWYIDTHQEGL